jgi:hypothetical protein
MTLSRMARQGYLGEYFPDKCHSILCHCAKFYSSECHCAVILGCQNINQQSRIEIEN